MTLWEYLPDTIQQESHAAHRLALLIALRSSFSAARLTASHGSARRVLENLRATDVAPELETRTWLKQVDGELGWCRRARISLISREEESWPAELDALAHPPFLLLVKGTLPERGPPRLAMVGSRAASEYGRRMAAKLASQWARRGGIVVSGGAAGIDAVSHQACLDAQGKTIAVLGSGLRSPYPAIHGNLFAQIAAQGALVTERPSCLPAARYHFTERNRLVAAFSDAVLVVQCKEGSGALHTAEFARKLGRRLFALPGPVDDPACQGSNQLLAAGLAEMADERLILALGTRDEAGSLGRRAPAAGNRIDPGPADIDGSLLDPSAQRVLSALAEKSLHFDDLSRAVDLGPAPLSALLLEYELAGWVSKESGNRFRLLVNLKG